MSEKKDPPAGDEGGSGGTPDEKPGTVTREAYERLLSEKKADAAKRKLAEDELEKFRNDKKKRDDDELANQKKFEELAANKDKENSDLKLKLAERDEVLNNQRKLGAFLRSVGTPIDPKWHHMIDIDRLKLDAEGNVDSGELSKYVEEYKKTYPETLAKPGKAPPTDHSKGTGDNAGKIPHSEWLKLPFKERQKRMKDIDPQSL